MITVENIGSCIGLWVSETRVHQDGDRRYIYIDHSDAERLVHDLQVATFEPAEVEQQVTEDEWLDMKQVELDREAGEHEYRKSKEG